MSRYKKYTDTHPAMLEALGIRLYSPERETSEEKRKRLYTRQIDADKSRGVVVELRQEHNALESKNIIFDHAHYEKYPDYTQGDYDARVYCLIHKKFPDQVDNAAAEDYLYKFELGFSYINDKGVPCALGITRLGHAPDAQYTIALIHNTVDAYEKRQVQFICTEKIAQSKFSSLRDSHNEMSLDATGMVKAVTDQIGSAEISKLFRTILDESGNISEQKLVKLKTRLGQHNLDDRDLLIPQISRIMAAAKKLESPDIAFNIEKNYSENSLEFFEHDHYKTRLKLLITTAENQKPRNPEVIRDFQDLYLEFITIGFYYRGEYIHNKESLPEEKVTALQTEYSEALQTEQIDSVAFKKKINQYYRAIHYNNLVEELEQAIIRTSDPDIKSIARKEIDDWLKKCCLTQYEAEQQNTIIEFVNKLSLFTEKPDTVTLTKLGELYPKVCRDQSGLASIKSRLEAENFAKQLAELEENIANCQHPYIKTEAETKLHYFKNRPFEKEDSTRQTRINDLLTTLNKFIYLNKTETLKELEELYASLDLIPIEPEKAETLLLPLNIAQIRHQIDHNQYTFDPQGRVLFTTFGSNQNPDVITWNLDITDAPNTDMKEQLNQPLLTELNQQQISSSNAPNIITLFNRNKTAIYPLQQVLQMYLSQIAQVYQVTMQAEGVTPQMMQTALMETNKEMNAVVIQHLAKGLVSASVVKRQILKNLDIKTLNKTLIHVQDTLRRDGKETFYNHLREQIQSPKKTPHALSPNIIHDHKISNKTLYFDTKKSLATEISTLQSDSEDTYRQIKTYRCPGTSFISSNVIPRSIIHSTALNIRAKMPTAAYQTQFQEKLTQLSKTCRYKENPALTYYLYAADDLQIQQTLNATHAYNRVISCQDSMPRPPLCFVQAPNMSESNKKLGYPMLDWSGAISDLTLMHEMSLCSQIAAVDNSQVFDLKDYFNFLNPSTSVLGGLTRGSIFVFSIEGIQMKNQIQTLKTAWQQDENLELDLGNQKFTTKTLQKMMAFDLHYDPQYAPLIQAMSLTISQQTLLNDASNGQVLADTLGRAQIFDIHPLPAEIQPNFNMLLTATDKQAAIIAADLLQNKILTYCAEQPNSTAVAAMLPLMAQQTQIVQNETTTPAIKQAQSDLISEPEVNSKSCKTDYSNRFFEKKDDDDSESNNASFNQVRDLGNRKKRS